MDYTRGNDLLSALKFFYQNKYGISTEILSECRSIPEVICTAEKLQLPKDEAIGPGNGVVDIINSLAVFYKSKKEVSKPAPQPVKKADKKSKRFEEKKVQAVEPAETNTEILTEEAHA
jgi:hypothetical protein